MPRIIDEQVPRIIDERVPAIIEATVPDMIDRRVQPMLDRLENQLEKRLTVKIDQLTLDVGQFSLETTNNFMALNAHLDDLDDGLAKLAEI